MNFFKCLRVTSTYALEYIVYKKKRERERDRERERERQTEGKPLREVNLTQTKQKKERKKEIVKEKVTKQPRVGWMWCVCVWLGVSKHDQASNKIKTLDSCFGLVGPPQHGAELC